MVQRVMSRPMPPLLDRDSGVARPVTTLMRPVRRRAALGEYTLGDDQTFPDDGSMTDDSQLFQAPELPAALRQTLPLFRSAVTPFLIGQASVLVLPANPRRSTLFIQNRRPPGSTELLYFSLGGDANPDTSFAFAAGGGVFYDYNCPADSVYLSYSGTGTFLAVCQESVRVA